MILGGGGGLKSLVPVCAGVAKTFKNVLVDSYPMSIIRMGGEGSG